MVSSPAGRRPKLETVNLGLISYQTSSRWFMNTSVFCDITRLPYFIRPASRIPAPCQESRGANLQHPSEQGVPSVADAFSWRRFVLIVPRVFLLTLSLPRHLFSCKHAYPPSRRETVMGFLDMIPDHPQYNLLLRPAFACEQLPPWRSDLWHASSDGEFAHNTSRG
jgi:hypothetical protein